MAAICIMASMKYFSIFIVLALGIGLFISSLGEDPQVTRISHNKAFKDGNNEEHSPKNLSQNKALSTIPLDADAATSSPNIDGATSKIHFARGLKLMPLPAPPWAEKIDGMSTEAKNNPEVAFKLARLLLICAKTPTTTKQYKKTLSDLLEYHLIDGNYVDDNASQVARLKSHFAACRGIPDQVRLSYHRWLTNAAENGNVFAQVRYGTFPVPEQLKSQDISAKEIKDYRSRALHYLDMAVAQGNADAMFWRGQAALAGIIAPKDPLDAYAYISAANVVFSSNDIDRDLDGLLNKLKKKILPRKLPQAEQKSDSLLHSAHCCTYLVSKSTEGARQ